MMKKRYFLALILVTLIMSCGNSEEAAKIKAEIEATEAEVEVLKKTQKELDDASNNLDKLMNDL